MQTPPHEHVIPSDPLPSSVEDAIVEVVSMLEEVRNFGTYVLAWVGQVQPPDPLRLAPMLLFRHALEQLDGICMLIKNHAPDAAMVNLRALMEVWLYIWYICKDDSDRRAAAYLVWYYIERQKWFRRYLPETEIGKQYRDDIKGDGYAPGLLDGLPLDEVRKSVDRIDGILAQPEYSDMVAHYRSLMTGQQNNRPRSWFHLAGGPKDIRSLAFDLGAVAVYTELYKSLSGVVHASSIMEGKLAASNREGLGAFKQLRLLSNLGYVVRHTMNCSTSICRHMVSRYAPSKAYEMKRWYVKEVRSFILNKLPTLDIRHE